MTFFRAAIRRLRRRGLAVVAARLLVAGTVAVACVSHAQQPLPPAPLSLPPVTSPPPPPPRVPIEPEQVPPADAGTSGSSLFPNTGSVRRPTGTPAAAAATSRATKRATRRDRFAVPALSQAAGDTLDVRIAFRRAKTVALLDPRLAELLREADRAHGDDERRELLRIYYEDLFSRIRRIDRSAAMAAHVAILSRAASQRYAPQRVLGGLSELSSSQSTTGGVQRR